METRTEKINILDLPGSLVDTAFDHISRYSVALLRITTDKNIENMQLIGSGTLVIINNFYSILTAEHVLAEIKPSDHLGLLTSFTGSPHRFKYDQNCLYIHKIAKGEDDSMGPDIGLIVLPQVDIGLLKAQKSFFNIDKRKERFSKSFLEKDRGFWFTCGFPGEWEIDLLTSSEFSSIKGYKALFGVSGISKEYEASGYDYLEMTINYNTFNPELPVSFGGVSGSGVWQVPLIKSNNDKIEPEEYVFSGVVFYQTQVEENNCLIRCHGRRTIYFKVPELLSGVMNS
ncbi:MAG: hypothetical protein ABII90_11095 [Bacteroidota bacterium]